MRNRLRDLFRRRPGKCKALILSPGRTGTTVLERALDRHSQMRFVGEVLNSRRDSIPYTDLIRSLYGYSIKGEWLTVEDRTAITDSLYLDLSLQRTDGITLLYDHLAKAPRSVLHYLRNRRDLRIIHLVRENELERFVSYLCATKTSRWHLRKGDRPFEIPKLEVDVNEFFAHARNSVRRAAEFDEFFGSQARKFYFEDLEKDWKGFIDVVEDYLGIRREILPTVFTKSIRSPMSEVVTNYESLKEQCQSTEFAYCFEESHVPASANAAGGIYPKV